MTKLVERRVTEIDTKIVALHQLRHELKEIQRLAQSIPRKGSLSEAGVCRLIEHQTLTEDHA